MSVNSYGRYNIYLAKLLGLEVAVYYDLLILIADLAVSKNKRKHTLTSDGYFKVDRKYIRDQTSISTENQRIYDLALSKLHVLYIDETDKDLITLDLQTMYDFIVDSEKDSNKKSCFKAILSEVKDESKKQKSITKKQNMINRWLTWIAGSDKLKDVYTRSFEIWYEQNYQTDLEIQARIDLINKCSTNEQFKIEVLKHNILTKYRDLNFDIEAVKKTFKVPQKVATAVNQNVVF
jgi:hypothetical protein